ncbi:hypothetical protein BGZ52_007388, partial [Haplosporangium bisporale]
MPPADVDDFGKSAMGLTGRHLTRVDINQLVAMIQAKYLQAKKWLQWHLNDNVGKFIFLHCQPMTTPTSQRTPMPRR